MIMLEAQYTTNKTDPWIGYITTAGTDQQMQGWSLIAEAVILPMFAGILKRMASIFQCLRTMKRF